MSMGPAFALTAALAGLGADAGLADSRSFLLFFDNGKPELSRDASDTLAKQYQGVPAGGHWIIVGYADRSGSTATNARLGFARAKVVREKLIELGADEARIEVSSGGESRSIVPTSDGVREPQNRRVEVSRRP
jgi:OmpA-OmpF porin, OOP family